MTISEFTPLLTRQVNLLPAERVVDFALDICERLLPEYINFYNLNKWGNPEILKEAIEFCKTNKNFPNVEIYKLKELHKAVESVIPDMDFFGDFNSSYALNASCSVVELLDFWQIKIKNMCLISVSI